MNRYNYDTVSEAVRGLNNRGYTIDFNSEDPASYNPDDFEIVEVHRFEGDSDPADEAVVYAIEAANGLKGILVSGFGISSDSFSNTLLNKLHFQKQ